MKIVPVIKPCKYDFIYNPIFIYFKLLIMMFFKRNIALIFFKK